MINPFELFSFFDLQEEIKRANDPIALYKCIKSIEHNLGFIKSTLYDNPYFLIRPGTHKKTHEWLDALADYTNPSREEITKLLESGFVIVDREEISGAIDMLEPLGFKSEYLLLDKEYGLLILPQDSLKKNFYFGMSELSRYGETYPPLRDQLSNIFSLGALRGHVLMRQKAGYTPIEIEVNSKEEILSHVDLLHRKIQESNSRFRIWYRGQTDNFLINPIDEILHKHCPWRSIVDISLVPSLFRKSEKIQDSLKDYAEKMFQVLSYEMALNDHLSIPIYDNRKDLLGDYTKHFEGTIWEDSNSPMSTTVTDPEGNILEIHDYNPIYRALQTSLFLQHYGIPTNILDITKSLDVALFFAQNTIIDGKYERQAFKGNSVIYLFLLDPKTDRFLDSTEILEEFNILRPIRQQCGILAGASYSSQNYYSKFISIKFILKQPIAYNDSINAEYLFPQSNEDDILSFLQLHSDRNKFENVKPF
jgi:hypothetical protein